MSDESVEIEISDEVHARLAEHCEQTGTPLEQAIEAALACDECVECERGGCEKCCLCQRPFSPLNERYQAALVSLAQAHERCLEMREAMRAMLRVYKRLGFEYTADSGHALREVQRLAGEL